MGLDINLRMRDIRRWNYFVIGWPINTLLLLGMMLAIDLTFQGISAIGFGLALKRKV